MTRDGSLPSVIAAVAFGAVLGAWLRWALSYWLNPRLEHLAARHALVEPDGRLRDRNRRRGVRGASVGPAILATAAGYRVSRRADDVFDVLGRERSAAARRAMAGCVGALLAHLGVRLSRRSPASRHSVRWVRGDAIAQPAEPRQYQSKASEYTRSRALVLPARAMTDSCRVSRYWSATKYSAPLSACSNER